MGCKIYAESLKLMKDDLKEILGTTAKPHNPTDFVTITDEQFALEQWKKEIDDVDASIHDRQLALKVARVPRADAALISAILKEEDRSRTDRRIALHMSGNMAPAAEDQSSPSLYEQQMCRVVGTIMAEEKPDLKRSAVDISKDENGNGNESKQASLECVACGEQGIFFTMVEAPCSHYYCQVCLIQLFSASLKDESLFPPRCCRIPMPLEPVRTLIGPETSRRVEAKNIEISDTSRTYCSKQTCSAYIPPDRKQGNCGTCQECKHQTCILCKEDFHTPGKCVTKLDPVFQLAEAEGWKRCFKCRNLVELDTDCNHITCRCRYEFCYVCGKKWQTCTCPIWDERRLFDRANRIAARNNAMPGVAIVNEVVEMLRQRHECDHRQGWAMPGGEFRCEQCNFVLPKFIYECNNCHLHVCRRCKQNRL